MAQERYQSIQLLRAVAAIMVVVMHSKVGFSPSDREKLIWIPGVSDVGWVGVTLFFVISGFIIANTLDKPDFQLGEFLWKRAVRIFPLYWIAMALGLTVYFWWGWFKGDVSDLGTAGMVKSFLIFPQAPYPFWNPGWSLEHEVIFYIIAGMLGPLVGLRLLAALMLALGTTGFFISFWDFHLFDNSQLCFGAGIVAYLCKGRSWRFAAGLAVAFLIVAYIRLYSAPAKPPADTTVWFTTGFAALIVFVVGLEKRGVSVPAVAVLLGNASYSLYLFHWLFVMFGDTLVYRYGGAPEFWRWALIAASIIVSIGSYRLVELPLNRWAANRHRSRSHRQAVV